MSLSFVAASGDRGWIDSPNCKDARHGFADLVVRRARTGGDPDAQHSFRWQPRRALAFGMVRADQSIANEVRVDIDLVRIGDVISRHLLSAQRRQRNRVAGVVATDNNHQVEWFTQ